MAGRVPEHGSPKAAKVDRAFAELDRAGKLAPVFARWHVLYTPPKREETTR